jgi:hypothetical protein
MLRWRNRSDACSGSFLRHCYFNIVGKPWYLGLVESFGADLPYRFFALY